TGDPTGPGRRGGSCIRRLAGCASPGVPELLPRYEQVPNRHANGYRREVRAQLTRVFLSRAAQKVERTIAEPHGARGADGASKSRLPLSVPGLLLSQGRRREASRTLHGDAQESRGLTPVRTGSF